jgi:hypothetical protein
MFEGHKGCFSEAARRKAEYETGLKWRKIYKFIYDRLDKDVTRRKPLFVITKVKHPSIEWTTSSKHL